MKGTKTISVVSKKVKKGYIERDAFLVFFSLSLNEKPFKPFDETEHIDYRPFAILSQPFDEAR
jgi:hypothetical protein